MFKYKMGRIGFLSLAAVLGGAMGNLIDRIFLGHVIDMFEFEFVKFAVFNIADIFITVGGIVFCIYFIIHSGQKTKKPKRLQSQRTRRPVSSAADTDSDMTEAKILEDYELERLFSEDDSADPKH